MGKMEEQWKPINGYEGSYEISNFGRVKSLSRRVKHGGGFMVTKERLLKSAECGNGYLLVSICRNDKKKTKMVHRLVWDAFGDKKLIVKLYEIDHRDGNKLNNHINNLKILSIREHRTKHCKLQKSSSQYIGVSWQKDVRKWKSEIRVNGKYKYLGIFVEEFDAHLAYQNYLSELNSE